MSNGVYNSSNNLFQNPNMQWWILRFWAKPSACPPVSQCLPGAFAAPWWTVTETKWSRRWTPCQRSCEHSYVPPSCHATSPVSPCFPMFLKVDFRSIYGGDMRWPGDTWCTPCFARSFLEIIYPPTGVWPWWEMTNAGNGTTTMLSKQIMVQVSLVIGVYGDITFLCVLSRGITCRNRMFQQQ
jgi:hypothetical protein